MSFFQFKSPFVLLGSPLYRKILSRSIPKLWPVSDPITKHYTGNFK